ncbi:cell wall-binding repeat-containing protein [Agromyces sp. SYSU K20354]|uniref:cell wall-binding repeat-containing protein n=1 Tax=Agromyces cavernae TaxID=2898659 RepID=UPI001E29D093|nr:cell wall-binding repeat-containing protein [Agromyces cavernae]MCD2442712.1 cell wall-binding repeat-containing protein [Agromyces cavernae]
MRRRLRAGVVAIAAAAIIGFGTTLPAEAFEPVPGQGEAPAVTVSPTAPGGPGSEQPLPAEPTTEAPIPAGPEAPTTDSPMPSPPPPLPTAPTEHQPDPDPEPDPLAPPGDPVEPDPTIPPLHAALTDITPFAPGAHRLAGADRYETAVAISQRFAPVVPVLYVATGADFPDALTAAAAAAHQGGPLLLTRADALPVVVREEIGRLAPARIVVAGGEAVVGSAVYDELATMTPSISRVGGSDRFETAELLIAGAFTASTQAFVATSRDFPDALAASAAAGRLDAPVFLVDGLSGSVRPSTVAALRNLGVQTVRIAGSTGAVGAAVGQQFALNGFTVMRHQGVDRYLTAAAINEAVFGGVVSLSSAFITTGSGFADALAGAALAGGIGAPLYLTRSECIPHVVSVALNERAPAARVVLGGTNVVSDAVEQGTACAMVWAKPAVGRITGAFGPRAPICTPGGCSQSFHRGIDLGTGCGAPIYAASGGRVTSAGWLGTYGNWVKIAHGSGIDTGYAHLANGGILVRVGQLLRAGQQVGWSGATGAATGCHLHFEVYQGGVQIDPAPFMALRGIRLG